MGNKQGGAVPKREMESISSSSASNILQSSAHSLSGSSKAPPNKLFHKWEKQMLKQTFNDLAQRSKGGKTIDKEVFLKFFSSLPGILGERLFYLFTECNNTQSIDFNQFVSAIAVYSRGRAEDKIKFIFKMYNLNNSGKINKNELETMLNSFIVARDAANNNTNNGTISGKHGHKVSLDINNDLKPKTIITIDTPTNQNITIESHSPTHSDSIILGSAVSFLADSVHTAKVTSMVASAMKLAASDNAAAITSPKAFNISNTNSNNNSGNNLNNNNNNNNNKPQEPGLSLYTFAKWIQEYPEVLEILDLAFYDKEEQYANFFNSAANNGEVSRSEVYNPITPHHNSHHGLIEVEPELQPYTGSYSYNQNNKDNNKDSNNPLLNNSGIATSSSIQPIDNRHHRSNSRRISLPSANNNNNNPNNDKSNNNNSTMNNGGSTPSTTAGGKDSNPLNSTFRSEELRYYTSGRLIHCDNCNADYLVKYCYSCGGKLMFEDSTKDFNNTSNITNNSNNNPTSSGAGGSGNHGSSQLLAITRYNPKELIYCESCHYIYHNGVIRNCTQCGFDFSQNGIKQEPSLHKTINNNNPATKRTIEGYLYKVGARLKTIIQRYYIIKDRFLYTYDKQGQFKPSHVLYLEGCFVEPVNHEEKNSKLKYGMELILNEEPKTSKFLYCTTSESRNQWLEIIKIHSNIHSVNDYYSIGEELGVGRFSSVRMCISKATNKRYAVKIIDKLSINESEREALRTEVAVLKLLNHPNIIRLKNVFETRKEMYLIMSFIRGGDLFDRISKRKRYTEAAAQSLMFQLISVVNYLHTTFSLVHRDLKPENIFLQSADNDCNIVLGDFGLSKFAVQEDKLTMACGTLAYCFSGDHQVLTLNGFKYFNEITQSDQIAAVTSDNHNQHSIVYQPPVLQADGKYYIERELKQDRLIQIQDNLVKGTGINIVCTDNHDLYGELCSTAQIQKIKAGEFIDSTDSIKLLAHCQSGYTPSEDSRNKFKQICDELGLVNNEQINAFIEYYGYWCGDGSLGYFVRTKKSTGEKLANYPYVEISTVKDKDYIEDLLKKIGLKRDDRPYCIDGYSYTEGIQKKFSIKKMSWRKYFHKHYYTHYKRGPEVDAIIKAQEARPVKIQDFTVLCNCSYCKEPGRVISYDTHIVDDDIEMNEMDDSVEIDEDSKSEEREIEEEDENGETRVVVVKIIKSAKGAIRWVFEYLTVAEIRLFLHGYRVADGYWSGGLSHKRVLYTSSPQVRDELFQLGLLAGYSVRSEIMYEVGDNRGICNNREIIPRNTLYRVCIADSNSCNALYPVINSNQHSSVISAPTNTKVYCVTVNSGLIIVRRVLQNNVSKPVVISNCAPEILNNTGYGKEIDLWSCGIICYLLLRGVLPFDSDDREVVIAKTVQGKIPFEHPIWNEISLEAKSFITSLLQVDPTKRVTSTEALEHNWFKLKLEGGLNKSPKLNSNEEKKNNNNNNNNNSPSTSPQLTVQLPPQNQSLASTSNGSNSATIQINTANNTTSAKTLAIPSITASTNNNNNNNSNNKSIVFTPSTAIASAAEQNSSVFSTNLLSPDSDINMNPSSATSSSGKKL